MNWVLLLSLAVMALAIFLLRKLALISAPEACQHLRGGAVIVDVRTPEEFAQRHVPGAINLPLSRLPGDLLRRISDREQVLLLHCQGGGRSAMAQRLLRAEGFRRAYNLGSIRRAEAIARVRERE